MKQLEIRIKDIEDASDFTSAMGKTDVYATINQGVFNVSARSLLGIMNLDMMMPMTLNVDVQDDSELDRVRTAIGPFLVKG